MFSRALARILLAITGTLPASWVRRLFVSLTPLIDWHPAARRGLRINARHLLGPDASPQRQRELSRGVLRSFGRALADLSLGQRLFREIESGRLPVEVVGGEHLEPYFAPGRGFVTVSLHMGSYEVACMMLSERKGEVTVVYHRDPSGFFEEFRSRRRGDFPIHEVAIDRSPYFGVELLERLRSGGAVLMAGELAAGTRGESFEFLGGEAHFSLWPARLAETAGVPVIPAFIARTDSGGFRMHLEPPLEPGDHDSPRDLMESLVSVFETYVKRYPDQWLMVRPFWPE